jgi:hypothetical protein
LASRSSGGAQILVKKGAKDFKMVRFGPKDAEAAITIFGGSGIQVVDRHSGKQHGDGGRMPMHRDSSTSPGSRKAAEDAADCLNYMSVASTPSMMRGAGAPGWEESEHEGLLTMLDERKKRWYRCKNEECNYINDRLYHSKMHYERIHIKNGVAMPRKRKYDTLPASVAEASFPSHCSRVSDYHPAAKQAKQTIKPASKQSPKTPKSSDSAAVTPRYTTPKQQQSGGKASSVRRTPENCKTTAAPSSGACATKLFDLSPANNKIYTFGEGFSFSNTGGLSLNAADLVRPSAATEGGKGSNPASSSTAVSSSTITSLFSRSEYKVNAAKRSGTDQHSSSSKAASKDSYLSPPLTSSRECPPSPPSAPLCVPRTPVRTPIRSRVPTTPPSAYRQPRATAMSGFPTSCAASPAMSPVHAARTAVPAAFPLTPIAPTRTGCVTPGRTPGRAAASPSIFLRTPNSGVKREGRVVHPIDSLLCTEDMHNDIGLRDMEELMDDSTNAHGDVFSAWTGISAL